MPPSFGGAPAAVFAEPSPSRRGFWGGRIAEHEAGRADRTGWMPASGAHDAGHIAAAARIPAGVVWVDQWQGGGPERRYEPAFSPDQFPLRNVG